MTDTNSVADSTTTYETDRAAAQEVSAEVDETQEFPKKQLRRNMLYCIMLDTIWSTGWVDWSIALAPLLVYLGASNMMIGVIQGATFPALIGNFISPWITRRFRIKKWYLCAVNVPYVGAIGLAGLMVLFSGQLGLSSHWLLMFVFAMVMAHHFFSGFVALPHQEYVAACIPMSHRGRLAGVSISIGSAAAIGSSIIGGLILYHYTKPMSFGYLFVMTWVICQSGYIFALFAKEKPTPVERSPKPWSRDMLGAAWGNKPYVRVVTMLALIALTYAPVSGFIAIYGFRDLKMIAAASAVIAIISQVVRIAGSGPIGFIVDKWGGKRVVPYTALGTALACLIIVVLHSPLGVFIAIAVWGLSSSVSGTALSVLIYGLPKPEDRAGQYTIQLLAASATNFIGQIIVGQMCDMLPYRTVFMIYGVVALAFYPLMKYMLSILSDDMKAYS